MVVFLGWSFVFQASSQVWGLWIGGKYVNIDGFGMILLFDKDLQIQQSFLNCFPFVPRGAAGRTSDNDAVRQYVLKCDSVACRQGGRWGSNG